MNLLASYALNNSYSVSSSWKALKIRFLSFWKKFQKLLSNNISHFLQYDSWDLKVVQNLSQGHRMYETQTWNQSPCLLSSHASHFICCVGLISQWRQFTLVISSQSKQDSICVICDPKGFISPLFCFTQHHVIHEVEQETHWHQE